MTLSKRFSLMILTVCILSYGMSGAAFAQTNGPPLSIVTDAETYTTGNTVYVSGHVKDYDGSNVITLRVLDFRGNIIAIAQLTPDSNGDYSTEAIASGPLWKASGDYEILVNYGAQKASVTFGFISTGTTPEPVEVEPVETDPEPVEVDPEPVEVEPEPVEPTCGAGTELVDGMCQVISQPEEPRGGGCLIATATYGSELAPQVQFLREIRDNTLLSTSSGTTFMTGFNQFYYSFSPIIADWERENPVFKETVKVFITPMISSLSIMTLADEGSESQVLGLGISIIALNLGMYIAAPAAVVFKVRNHLKSRKKF